MTDESEILRRIIEDRVRDHLKRAESSNNPPDVYEIARRIAEDVLRDIERLGVQILRMHALGPYRER